ncbi:SCO3242 family prenyltransferase [Streptomyces sp. NPDC002734]|uniref:SCO3242 family prenyltransferase n=1 Tax=Streptomyces sp. NPDC002734 TaxID=3154426 RepID=UPI00331FB9EB
MSAARDWAELLRVPALFTVPGDALAGAVAGGGRPRTRTLGAVAASLCLYAAGMALNDWADREEDARERPGRPLPSGRIRPGAALAAAAGLTAAGLGCAALAGRRTAAVAVPLAATVWAYDLHLKHTPLGPPAMGAARALDLLMGAASTGAPVRALPSALAVGAHTCAVTVVSRHETRGGAVRPSVAALAVTAAVTAGLVRSAARTRAGDEGGPSRRGRGRPTSLAAAAFAVTSARPLLHAVLNPSPQLTQRAVGGGIRALVPLQAALAARAGAPATALLTAALAPVARRLGRKVSLT